MDGWTDRRTDYPQTESLEKYMFRFLSSLPVCFQILKQEIS